MPKDFSAISIDWMEKAEIWEIADTVRAKCWNGKLPVDVDLIAEKIYGIQFIPLHTLKAHVHSEAFLTGALDEIDYEPNASPVRVRFSIAHELGHLVLHPKQIQLLRPTSFVDWKDTIDELPEAIWGRAEWQAREFAGRLLVPRENLIEETLRYKPEIEKAKKQIASPSPDDVIEFLAGRVCAAFRVSDIVIKTRMKNEEINPLSL